MSSQTVLILGNHTNRNLVQAVENTGLTPQVWVNMQHCLDKLTREQFAAVILDRKSTDADVLEFILNVRDIDETIPVVVVGPGKEKQLEKKIANQDHTMVLDESGKAETLARKLAEVLINKDEDI